MLGRVKRLAKGVIRTLINPIGEYSFITSPEYYRELQDSLHIAKVEGLDLVRTGRKHDVSWDKDAASRGCEVFMYDHTIDTLPEENPHFHRAKLGIADGITRDSRLKTLDELIAINHHEDERSMILKMDVEGAEWGFLERVSSETLSQFSQMSFEFHNITSHPKP